MKLKDLLLSDFINDETNLITSRPMVGNICDIRKGNWYQDHILDFMDFTVRKFDFDCDLNTLSVALALPYDEYDQKEGSEE